MRTEKKKPLKDKDKDKEKNAIGRTKRLKPPFSDYGRKVALLEEAITQMNEGRYSKAAITLKELLALDPHNMEARRLFATLHLRLGSLLPAKQAFDSLIEEAFARQDYWLAESLLREYLSAGPRCVPYLEKLGMLYLEKGQIVEAVAEYAKAIEFLIEDPDPDDPEHASRLYRHIKDLAPASPAVIRLNRYFDPHTGALIANSLNDPTEPFIELSEEEEQASLGDSPGSIEPVESGLESESILGVAAEGTEWSDDPSPLASTLEPLSVLEVERQDGTEALDEGEDCPQSESAAFVDGDPIARDATIEQTAQWSLAASCSEEDEPNEVINGHSTVVHEHLSVLTTDETAFVSTEEDQPIDAQMASSALGLGEDGPLSAVVEEVSGNPEVSLITEQSFEPSEFLQQVAEVPEASVNSVIILEKTAEKQAEGRHVADQQAEKGEERSSSITSIDDLERTTEPYEADGSETPLATEPIALSGDQPVESVDDVLVLANEAREAEMLLTCSVVSQVDPPFLATDPAGHSGESDPLPDERISALLIEEAVSEDQVMPSTDELSLVADERGEEQSVAAQLDYPEESADSIAPELEVGQSSESSWVYGQEAGHESDSSRAVLFPFTPSSLNVEERNQEEADEAGEEGAGAEERGEQDQQAKDHTESFGDSSATPLETSQVGREERGIDLAEEQGAEAAIANELTTWYEGEPQIEELAAAVEPNDADRSVRADEQVLETQEEGQDEVGVNGPGAGLLREQLAEPQLLDRGAPEEVASPVLDDEQASSDGPGQVFVATSLEPALGRSGSEDEDTCTDRSQPADIAGIWSSQDAVQLNETVQPGVRRLDQEVGTARSTVATAVEVLFNNTASQTASTSLDSERGEVDKATKRLRSKKPGVVDRIRGVIAEGVALSLSMTSLVTLASVGLLFILCAGVVLAIGAVGLTWFLMEESPSVLYQHVTVAPPRTISDPQKNGYLILIGFNAPEGQDPLQAGLVLMGATATREEGIQTAGHAATCGSAGGSSSRHVHAAAAVLSGWIGGSDPLGAIRANHSLLRSWMGQAETALIRYRQWQQLPFEDWGFGRAVAPPCDLIAFAHHLYLAEGFLQGIDTGLERLEADTEVWRTVLAQARTLPVKVLAIQAVRDNATVTSALLMNPDLDTESIGRLAHVFRPLNQTELSIRWSMHSELAVAAASYEVQLHAELRQAHSAFATIGSWFPLPTQRRLNAYAAYYDAAFKAGNGNESWRRGWPKRSDFVRFPAETIKDLLVNPIENLIGLSPLPAWDDYAGMVTDAEAHLRLVGLQAWIRRGGSQVDLFARIAKAGQGFYDPYTGLPMLVNVQKGIMYSVGHDGKDQNGDPQHDVVVAIPSARSTPSTTTLFRADSQ